MKKLALALMAASAAVFGFGMVASAAPSYTPAVTVTPPTGPAAPYSVLYRNCQVGETITFTQAQSTPNSVPVQCVAAPTPALTGSIVGLLLPQGTSALGTATANFTNAPTDPGLYNGSAVGTRSQTPVPWTITIAGTTPPASTNPPVVTTVPATLPGSGLPETGSNGIGTTTGIAIGLLVVGLGLFVVAQVRRRQAPTPA